MADYISREAASDLLEMALSDDWEPEYAQDRLSEIPAADVVTREAFNRILAENDIMREQLAKIGKKPGDSMTGIQMLTCCCCDGSKVVEIDQIKEDT